jgi:hypothetical protein
MAYCGPRGIPLSEFLAWSVDDQEAALAWMVEESGRCGGCGTHEWQWEADWDYAQAEGYVCPGCQKLATVRKNQKTEIPGMHFRLVTKAEEARRGEH